MISCLLCYCCFQLHSAPVVNGGVSKESLCLGLFIYTFRTHRACQGRPWVFYGHRSLPLPLPVCSLIREMTAPPRSGELRTQKLKSHLVRTQSLNVLPFKSGVGQYIAIHAMLTARDFFFAYFYPSGPFTCSFSKTSPDFSCVDFG